MSPAVAVALIIGLDVAYVARLIVADRKDARKSPPARTAREAAKEAGKP